MEQVRLCVYCGHLNNVVGGSGARTVGYLLVRLGFYLGMKLKRWLGKGDFATYGLE